MTLIAASSCTYFRKKADILGTSNEKAFDDEKNTTISTSRLTLEDSASQRRCTIPERAAIGTFFIPRFPSSTHRPYIAPELASHSSADLGVGTAVFL